MSGRRGLEDGDRRAAAGAAPTGALPGHLGFYWPERGFLIAGDAIATWPRFEAAGWLTINRAQHAASLRRMADLEAPLVGVGHDAITVDVARLHDLVEKAR